MEHYELNNDIGRYNISYTNRSNTNKIEEDVLFHIIQVHLFKMYINWGSRSNEGLWKMIDYDDWNPHDLNNCDTPSVVVTMCKVVLTRC